jgi:ABC-type transporter Mla subunit MlaD
MRRRTTGAVLANPVLVGAVTILVIVVAVFLAYNANSGLPFVPTLELKARVPNGAKLVPGNEVREGGNRIGVVSEVNPITTEEGAAGAELLLKLDQNAAPMPADSEVRIRPRSALGLKYVEVNRGTAADTLTDGDTVVAGEEALAPELQEFFNIFDEKTRANAQANLRGFGDAFAWRGMSINRAIEALPGFLGSLPPVMEELAAPDTQLARLFTELGDAARIAAPIADVMAQGFADGAATFDALARDRGALQQTIAESPETLAVGTTALRNTRPFLASLADVSGDLRTAAGELRRSAPPITAALRSGVTPLRQTPALARRLDDNFRALTALARSPGSDTGVLGLDETMTLLTTLSRYLAPYQTVCNYWNGSWTLLADHITDTDQTGQVQRIRVKNFNSSETSGLGSFGQAYPIPTLHAQINAAAIDENGDADCESGQRGFPRHLAAGVDDNTPLAGDPITPGNQGTTFTGKPRVPEGSTFSARPENSPEVRLPSEFGGSQ